MLLAAEVVGWARFNILVIVLVKLQVETRPAPPSIVLRSELTSQLRSGEMNL